MFYRRRHHRNPQHETLILVEPSLTPEIRFPLPPPNAGCCNFIPSCCSPGPLVADLCCKVVALRARDSFGGSLPVSPFSPFGSSTPFRPGGCCGSPFGF